MIQIGLCAYKRGTKMHYVFIELCHYSQWDCLNFQHYFLLPRSNTQRCILPAHGWRREGLVVHVLSCEGVGDTTADRQNVSKMQLVFGCICTNLCKQIRVLQHFSKSTRLSSSIFLNLAKFADFATFAIFFAEISRKLLIFQTDFLRKF